jgi:hypothetical protein
MKSATYFVLCGCALFCSSSAAQRITFDAIPSGWDVQGKPFTRAAVFTIQDDPEQPGHCWLSMTADKASASLLSGSTLSVDLKKTPILRWRWRVTVLPSGADGRDPKKDDQAIGLYISSGSRFKQQSIAYRWETQPPSGADGFARYAAGTVSIKWFALRDESHADGKTFFIEERNVAEDFQKAFGAVPERIGLGISCNSQYTGSSAEAQLDWIEFVAPAP